MALPEPPLDALLSYRAAVGSPDPHPRLPSALGIAGLMLAVSRIGMAAAGGQTELGIFVTMLPRIGDLRYWYIFIRGPVTLLLGLSLLMASLRLLLNGLQASRWLFVSETVALVLLSSMVALNLIINLSFSHGTLSWKELLILPAAHGLLQLMFPCLVVLLLRR